MDIISQLNEFIEESSAHQPYTIEKQLTGSIVVWNIPDTLTDLLDRSMNTAVKAENVNAIRKLVGANIHPENEIYRLTIQTGKTGNGYPNRCNMRFHLSYTGPKLQKQISGIYSTKDNASQWLHRTLKAQVDKAKLIIEQPKKKVEKPVNVAYQSRFVKFIGKHTAYEMIFVMIPNKKQYIERAIQAVPEMINNIVITPVSREGDRVTFRMNAAGRPWLVRIGQIIDEALLNG